MPQLEIARFTPMDGTRSGRPFNVHFNPASLDYTVENKLQGAGGGRRAAQYVARTNGKLSMELLFDTTHSGEDVRRHTEQLAKLMKPGGGGQSRQRRPPPRALFEWGAYAFDGVIESYREKIDFFSADGVPLRATVTLSLSGQDLLFEKRSDVGGSVGGPEGTVEAPLGARDNVAQAAERAGDGAAARSIASANGFESIRSPGAAVVRLGAEVTLGPPVAFAAGASFGLDAGLSLDFGLEIGGGGAAFGAAAGLDVDFGVSGSVSASASAGIDLAGVADIAAATGVPLQTSMDLGGSVQTGAGGGQSGGGAGGVGQSGSGVGQGGGGVGQGGSGVGQGGSGVGGVGQGGGVLKPPGQVGGVVRAPGRVRAPILKAGGGGSRPSSILKFTGQFGSQAGLQAAAAASGEAVAAASEPRRPSTSAGSEQERGVFSAGVPAAANPFSKLVTARGFRRHSSLDPESLVRSVDIEGYGTGAGVGFRIGGQATLLGESSVAADVGQKLRLSDRIRFDGERGGNRR